MARGLDGFADDHRESTKYRYIGPSTIEPLDTFRISGHIGPLSQWLNPPEMVARPHLLTGAMQPLIVPQPTDAGPAWIAMIRFVLRGDVERWLQLRFDPNVEYQESGEPNVSGMGGWDTGNMRSFMGFWSTDEDWLRQQAAAAD